MYFKCKEIKNLNSDLDLTEILWDRRVSKILFIHECQTIFRGFASGKE
jgi:hypothetical protein